MTTDYLTNIQGAHSKTALTHLGQICHYPNPSYCVTLSAEKGLLWFQPKWQLNTIQLLVHCFLQKLNKI